MLFWILVVVVPIHSLAVWSSYDAVARRLEADAMREADELAERLAVGFDAVIQPIEGAMHTVAFQLEQTNAPRARYLEHIRGVLDAWPDVYGCTIAAEINSLQDRPFAPYLYRTENGIGEADLASDSYGYRALPWYRSAADGRHALWSAPYFDAGGGEAWMVTYSVPFYRRPPDGGRALAGVVTADLTLDWVQRVAGRVALGPLGLGWISSGADEAGFAAAIGDTAQRVQAFGAPLAPKLVRAEGAAMRARGTSFGLAGGQASARPAYIAARTLRTLGWNLTLLIPRDELLRDARAQLRRQVVLGVVGLAALVFAVSLVAAGITRPIRELARSVGKAAADPGDEALNFRLPETSGRDELGVLTAALRRLRDSLQQHVQLRAESLAAQVRLDQELSISAQIQQSMLPHGEALHAVPAAIDIAARLVPARQVGGDLYDYFVAGDGQLLFAIADVSDKGIPAALFMARLSALLRVLGAEGASPEQLLAGINGRLADGNDACMFVTAGCGLLDPASGAFRYASAGHEPPLLRTLEGEVHAVAVESGAAIGFEADSRYVLQQGRLAPGDTLFLFTDGLSEAEGEEGELFGLPRIEALLREMADARPAALVARAVDVVADASAGFRQTDDLTVMALRFCPMDVTPRVESGCPAWLVAVEPTRAGLRRAQQRLSGILLARGFTAEMRHDAELVAEEWLSNVLKAAGNEALHHLSVELRLGAVALQLVFEDDGVPFDPHQAAQPDPGIPVAERPIGGLGLHLVKHTASRCDYTRTAAGRNVLVVEIASSS